MFPRLIYVLLLSLTIQSCSKINFNFKTKNHSKTTIAPLADGEIPCNEIVKNIEHIGKSFTKEKFFQCQRNEYFKQSSTINSRGKNPAKTTYLTDYRSWIVNDSKNQVKVLINGYLEPTGGVLFSFNNDAKKYIISESPLDPEVFLKTLWNARVRTFVSLEGKNQAWFNKVYRNYENLNIDLHHLENMTNNIIGSAFKVMDVKKIVKEDDYDVYSAKIYYLGDAKDFFQIKYKKWEEGKQISPEDLYKLARIVEKYSGNTYHSLFVSCELGVTKSRALAIALRILTMNDAGTSVDVDKVITDFFRKNYNESTISGGEFMTTWISDDQGSYRRLIADFASFVVDDNATTGDKSSDNDKKEEENNTSSTTEEKTTVNVTNKSDGEIINPDDKILPMIN